MSDVARRTSTWAGRLFGVLLAAGAIFALGVAVYFAQRTTEGPAEVAWDKEACAHCRMHVGERPFAAQLHRQDGRVHHFDDPGCLFAYLDGLAEEPKALWFHHGTQERWLSGAEVAFSPGATSPMGFGLVAVDQGTPGALTLSQAREAVRARLADSGPAGGAP